MATSPQTPRRATPNWLIAANSTRPTKAPPNPTNPPRKMPVRRVFQIKMERNIVAPPPPARSRLLALPAELAYEIYTLVLGDSVIHLLPRRIRGKELFPEDRDESLSPSPSTNCGRRREGIRSNYICDHKAPADANIVPSDPVCQCLTHCCAVTSVEQVDLALLFTCRETYNAASRILYSTNAFFVSASRPGSLGRRGHCIHTEPAVTQAYNFVTALRPASQALLRYLHIDHLTPNRVNFGLVIPFENWGEAEMKDTIEFQLGLEFLCEIIGNRSLPSLRTLGLGIRFPSLKGWKGGLQGVQWVRPLLELCQRPLPAAHDEPRLKIVLTPKNKLIRYNGYMGLGKKIFCFMDWLSGEMDDRRVEQGWMTGEGVKVVYRLVVDADDDEDNEGGSESEDGSSPSDDPGNMSDGETESEGSDGESIGNGDEDAEMTEGIENEAGGNQEGNDDGNGTIVDKDIESIEGTLVFGDGDQPDDAKETKNSLEGSHVHRAESEAAFQENDEDPGIDGTSVFG